MKKLLCKAGFRRFGNDYHSYVSIPLGKDSYDESEYLGYARDYLEKFFAKQDREYNQLFVSNSVSVTELYELELLSGCLVEL